MILTVSNEWLRAPAVFQHVSEEDIPYALGLPGRREPRHVGGCVRKLLSHGRAGSKVA